MRNQNISTQLDFNGILFHGFHKCFTLFSRAFLHVALDYFFAFVLWLYYFHPLTHVNILTVNFLKDCQKDCVSQWLLEFRSIALFLFNCILSLNVHACNNQDGKIAKSCYFLLSLLCEKSCWQKLGPSLWVFIFYCFLTLQRSRKSQQTSIRTVWSDIHFGKG